MAGPRRPWPAAALVLLGHRACPLVAVAAFFYDPTMTTPTSARGRYGETMAEGLLESPAAERNKEPILDAIRARLPHAGVVLEIASGTGQHIVHFARAVPALTWQPTDADDDLRAAATERIRVAGLSNVRAPLRLDALAADWPPAEADAIVCINMIHIAPWSAAEGLIAGAARVLPSGGVLYLYGPYKEEGRHTAPSNEAFDASLRSRNPEWGVRDMADVVDIARRHAFDFAERVQMPANNLSLVFRKG